MKTSSIPFAQLRQLLRDLHFTEARKDLGWRFDHPSTGTVFVFRPYTPDEKINMADLASVQRQLDWRGLLRADAFDRSLDRTSA